MLEVHMANRDRSIDIGKRAYFDGFFAQLLAIPAFALIVAGVLIMTSAGRTFLNALTRPSRRSVPHPYVIAVAALAVALHAYEQHRFGGPSGAPSLGWLLWSSFPYAVCLFFSSSAETRRSAIAAAVAALALDLWGHYLLFVGVNVSSGMPLLFLPLWNAIILMPLATFAAWWSGSLRSRA
jgi:hypothetical protein